MRSIALSGGPGMGSFLGDQYLNPFTVFGTLTELELSPEEPRKLFQDSTDQNRLENGSKLAEIHRLKVVTVHTRGRGFVFSLSVNYRGCQGLGRYGSFLFKIKECAERDLSEKID